MKVNDNMKLDSQLCFPLYAAARKIVNLYTPYLKPLGITYTQYIMFLVLWEEEKITVGDLCKRLKLDTGTVTPMLKNTEKQGLINRT
ncbi:MAG: MarR family transcriptional regulator, partial [Clostridiales bacterium]|nr:MarR family transcriptional regulator [Clostridiales bacterium]